MPITESAGVLTVQAYGESLKLLDFKRVSEERD
jgi:hypothetical protein